MDDLTLVITPSPGAVPVRRPVTKVLLTVGSDGKADVRLATVPSRWAVLRRDGDELEVRVLASGASRRLTATEPVVIDGVTLALERPAPAVAGGLPVQELAEALASVEAPDEALRLLLRGLLSTTGAESGAIILRQGEGYSVPVAERADGTVMAGAVELLSDTLVRDVLAGGEGLRLADAREHSRYANVPSVVSLKLRSVLCIPMALGERVLGAVFLGRRDPRAPFSERQAADLSVLATMALPLLVQLRRLNDRRDTALTEELLIGESPGMVEVRRLVARVAPSDLSVLVLGETGTGKERVAQAIHGASPRAGRPMVALNCAAVPESLLAAELFGARKGAFTGAVADRKGRVEAADGSTLFLDEVGDMPVSMQVMLLRVLEERKVVRVGDTEGRLVDFRLVAATSRDLDAEVAAGRFRRDLLYRLREVTLTLPRLAHRGEDIQLLAQLFLRQAERHLTLAPHQLTDEAHRALRSHGWPGNVRELRAVMRRAAILADGERIGPADLQLDAGPAAIPEVEADQPLDAARDAFVARYCAAALDRHGGNREAAAAALGISVRSLYRYLGGR